MIRIQLHLSEQQDRRLRALALRKGTGRAELIRRGIELLLEQEVRSEDAMSELIGAAGPAGIADVSERHDALLYVRDSADRVTARGRRASKGQAADRKRPARGK